MPNIPKKVQDRLVSGIKKFQPILDQSKSRDVGEADTVTIVKDMLTEVFGYDKYSEVTSEYAIKGTFCDLAIKLDNELKCLIEVKAIGLELKDGHVKQAVDYATNEGVDWVILTNGIHWRVYKVAFSKPIDKDLVIDINFCCLNTKQEDDLQILFMWCREAWVKSLLGDYHTQQQALSRFFIGNMLLSNPVLNSIRKGLKQISPDVRIEIEQIQLVLINEVIKREVMEGDKADEAKKKINKMLKAIARSKEEKNAAENDDSSEKDKITKGPVNNNSNQS
ncbi:MAG: type I restriction enzyme HsdR N-terminal domain-containing protein [Pirellulales bacterium]|nr:type I restriction enzyme HsdR N-terminal domain-containing protein [Pirellulales bacterium]